VNYRKGKRLSLKPKSVVQNAKGALQKPQRAMHGTQSADKSAKNKQKKSLSSAQ